MDSYFFVYTEYVSGRISIRDYPYKTRSAAQNARRRREKALAGNPAVKAVKIGQQFGITAISEICIKDLNSI